MPPQSDFTTMDTALAAWLYSEGNMPLKIETNGSITIFCFKNSNLKFRRLVEQFQSGQAKGNIVLFFRAYKRMLDIAKKGQYQRNIL